MRLLQRFRVCLTIIPVLAGMVLAPATPAAAPGRVAVLVPVLVSQDGLPHRLVIDGLREQLEANGFAPVFEVEELKGDSTRATASVRRLRERAQLLVTLGTLATQTAAREAPGVPVVSALVLNADDLRGHPNATGVVLEYSTEIELRWMQRVLPETRRVGVLYNPAQNQPRMARAVPQASDLGLTLKARPVASPRELPDNLASLVDHVDVLWGISDSTVLTPQTAQTLLLFSFRNQIPFVGLSRSWVKAGALYALERDYQDIGRQCGELADKILKGAAAASLPVQVPRKVGVVLNLKTARHFKVEFPAAVRQAALDVVE
jgi:putative ABC transport system substrate-binding protein